MSDEARLNRRHWMGATAGALSLAGVEVSRSGAEAAAPQRPRIAAIVTEFTYRSHAHVILENFLEPYYFNGRLTDPGVDVAALYVDQFPAGDMARYVARDYGVGLFPSIAEALRLGTADLAVDGVLLIGEHGDYPLNERGQKMYPRKQFFDEIVAVFRQSGRVLPTYNDKHLSYRWDWSAEMMAAVAELRIPFMAGSSVPLAQRRPPLELAAGASVVEAVSIHSGPQEVYDFHALEVLQSLVEGRRGGETGVAEVQLLEGDDLWRAGADGRWDAALAEAAMRAESEAYAGPLADFVEPADGQRYPAHGILVQYRDGLRATVLRIGKSSTRWNFACRLADEAEPRATSFYVGPWENRNLFKALSHAIQVHVRERDAPYPVERTYLTTGVLAAAMDSRYDGGRLLATPQLDIAYGPRDFSDFRELGETWKIITEDLPQPPGIDPGGPRSGA